MRIRSFYAVVGAAMLTFAGGAIAWGWPPSRLSAMAARQDLHDLVCIASSNGHLSAPHRVMLLEQARHILPPEEYKSFKRALENIPPPGSHHANTASLRPIPDAQYHKPGKGHVAEPKSAAQRKPSADLRSHVNSPATLKATNKVTNKSSLKPAARRMPSPPPMLAAKPRPSNVRKIAPPPKRSAQPAPAKKPKPAVEKKPAAEPEGPDLVVPVTAVLPDRMVPRSIAR
jgi:hypothetical protein